MKATWKKSIDETAAYGPINCTPCWNGMWECSSCGKEEETRSPFCRRCGAEMVERHKICPFCKQEGEPDMSFCPRCGHQLENVEEKIKW